MEGNKSSLVDDLFPRKEATASPKSDVLGPFFLSLSSIPGKSPLNQQSRGRLQGSDVLITIGKTLASDPCLMSSSVYYGGRDYFIPESTSSYKSGNTYNFKNDKEDDSSKLDFSTRGEWWQGSVYY